MLETYDLYLFDLDGLLVETEPLHYQAYKQAFQKFAVNRTDAVDADHTYFTYAVYCQLAHFNQGSAMENYFFSMYPSSRGTIQWTDLYRYKVKVYLELISDPKQAIPMMPGAAELIQTLIADTKAEQICVVTHSSRQIVEQLKKRVPLLQQIPNWIVKDDQRYKKPHPEAYLKAIQRYAPANTTTSTTSTRVIGFEDSYKGYLSLANCPDVLPILVCNPEYSLLEQIQSKFPDLIRLDSLDQIHQIRQITHENDRQHHQNRATQILDHHLTVFQQNRTSFSKIIGQLVPILKHKPPKANIFITGMGKSGHICQKTVSTWQSMGLNCHYVDLPSMPHGDYGILRNDDVVILVSNSGKCPEIVRVAKYLRKHFKVLLIGITGQSKPTPLTEQMDFIFPLNKITEADQIKMAPSTSSLIYLALLDAVGIVLAEDSELTKEKFQLYHPGGHLGQI